MCTCARVHGRVRAPRSRAPDAGVGVGVWREGAGAAVDPLGLPALWPQVGGRQSLGLMGLSPTQAKPGFSWGGSCWTAPSPLCCPPDCPSGPPRPTRLPAPVSCCKLLPGGETPPSLLGSLSLAAGGAVGPHDVLCPVPRSGTQESGG